ncbi:TOMM precursor leader peptide-binding protein [Amycolatopsis sp. A1MSW2902]|uniref:TOMM precursor leader peptide-binding protein n=1 Tax=Amycolatopsis sp. A1MSW2902 TaxID=687413 RepID=UPI00307EF5F9
MSAVGIVPAVTVTGRGKLFSAVKSLVAVKHGGTIGDTAPIRVHVSDGWNRLVRELASDDTASVHLDVWTEIGRVVIGPAEIPGLPGCGGCLDLRRHRARTEPEYGRLLQAQHGETLRARASGWITPMAASIVARLVGDEVGALLATSEPRRCSGAMLVIDLRSLDVRRHRFLPDPRCPRCGRLPEDTPELADLVLEGRPKIAPDVYRSRDISEDAAALHDCYVDPECGIVSSIVSGEFGGVAGAIATLRCRPHDALEPGFGRSATFRDARLTAVLEGLERYGGAEAGGRRPGPVASYDEIADCALDPRRLGLHETEDYAAPGFPFREFDPSARARWTWAHSFGRGGPVLVPEGVAFWHTHPPEALRNFCFEISNGCALGASLEEAILHGLLEVVERDSFLMTWYSSYSAPRIDLSRAADPAVRLLTATISVATGCEVLAFDTTMEHGIPSVWVMAVHPEDAYHRPKVLCAAAAHLRPEKALMTALTELGPGRAGLDDTFPADADRARSMTGDPAEVKTMDDHAVLYGAYEAFDRFDFLTRSGAETDLETMRESVRGQWSGPDLTDDLRDLIDRLDRCGMDVLVVDTTTPEHRVAGLRCVKVLVPGAIPITFGHRNRRLRGLDRLRTVPPVLVARLSSGSVSTTPNPHPHPFP